jgi:hypothetical protein
MDVEGNVQKAKDVKVTSPSVTRNIDIHFGGLDALSGHPASDNAFISNNEPPRELCLVTPSCRRAWDRGTFSPTLAGSAYTGPFSRKCQTYAERFYPGAWCILDARNGFLFPDEVIRREHDACLFRPWTEPIGAEELRSR